PHPRPLHSFPTRRSSDLLIRKEIPVMILKTRTLKTTVLCLLVAWTCALAARAQGPGDDPIARAVFPPDLVMKHAQEINLDERQRDRKSTRLNSSHRTISY